MAKIPPTVRVQVEEVDLPIVQMSLAGVPIAVGFDKDGDPSVKLGPFAIEIYLPLTGDGAKDLAASLASAAGSGVLIARPGEVPHL